MTTRSRLRRNRALGFAVIALFPAGASGFPNLSARRSRISFLDNFRCMRSRIICSDQALFVRRSLFDRLGGFPDRPMLKTWRSASGC